MGGIENNVANDMCLCFANIVINDPHFFEWTSCPNHQLPDCNEEKQPNPGFERFKACKAIRSPCSIVSDFGEDLLKINWTFIIRMIAGVFLQISLLVAIVVVIFVVLMDHPEFTKIIKKFLTTHDKPVVPPSSRCWTQRDDDDFAKCPKDKKIKKE